MDCFGKKNEVNPPQKNNNKKGHFSPRLTPFLFFKNLGRPTLWVNPRVVRERLAGSTPPWHCAKRTFPSTE